MLPAGNTRHEYRVTTQDPLGPAPRHPLPMKLMLLIPHVADGGAEKLLSQLSCGLRADELVVTVFERRVDYALGGRVISLDAPIHRGVIHRLTGLARRFMRFRKVLREEQPDVVLSFMGEANILNALLAPRPILTVHNHLSSLRRFSHSRMESWLSELLIRRLYPRGTVVTVSSAVRQDMIEVFKVPADRVTVIPNAIDPDEVRRLADEPVELPWKPGLPVILTAGRLTALKGQGHLIKAFARARRQTPCQLAILGAGELESELRETARQAGVESDTFFLGRQSNPWKFMARADVFVLPSLTEAFGLVLVEAMACGVPVISTDCPGAGRDILAPNLPPDASIDRAFFGDYGVLVPVGNEDELAAAILRFLNDKGVAKRYAESGPDRSREFSYPGFLERYQRLIESAAQSHPL
ncbi:MAG TPA: glycosyltransferase [Terriglobia bacterium]|nr:glycosyltransferase [Terriglobia bacterium]